jgi:hypothetical protein
MYEDKVREMRQDEMAQAPARKEIEAIGERVALAERLLCEDKRDAAALALDGLLWRMVQLMSGEYPASNDFILPDEGEMIARDGVESSMLMRLRLALRAPEVEMRVAQIRALLAYVEQSESLAGWEWSAPPSAGFCMRIAPWKGSI